MRIKSIILLMLISIPIMLTGQSKANKSKNLMPTMTEEQLELRNRLLNPNPQTNTNRNTVLVDKYGNGDYTTIQEAIDNTSDGDIIQVNPGVYTENLLYNFYYDASKEIRGAGIGATILQSTENPFFIRSYFADNDSKSLTISGFTFKILNNSSSVASISIQTCSHADGTYYGNSNCENNGNGYRENQRSKTIIIEECEFPNQAAEHGIYITAGSAPTVIIRNNLFNNSSYDGIQITEGSTPSIFVYNNIFYDIDQPIYYGVTNSSYMVNSIIEITNNIIYDSSDIYLSSSWDYWIAYNNRNNGNISLDYFPINNTDPQLRDIDNGDYRLSSSSPLIDAGNPDLIYNDLDGSRSDIGVYGGAYTWQGPVILNFEVTPDLVPQGGTVRIQATGSAQ